MAEPNIIDKNFSSNIIVEEVEIKIIVKDIPYKYSWNKERLTIFVSEYVNFGAKISLGQRMALYNDSLLNSVCWISLWC